MTTTNEKLRNVADIAARIMMGEKVVHPNQQKLDVHEPEKDELTAKDFEMLRAGKKAGVKKEEVDQLDELSVNKMLTYRSKATEKLGSDPSKDEKRKEGIRVSGEKVKAKVTGMKREEVEKDPPFDMPYKKAEDPKKTDKSGAVHTPMSRVKHLARQAMKKQMKEEFDLDITDDQADSLLEAASLDEMFPGTPEYEKKFGKAPQDLKKGEKKKTSKGEMEGTGKGVVHKRKFSEMVESYTEGGVKGLFKTLVEEPTSAEFDAEIKKAQAKSEGKEKTNVAKGAVQAVQNEQTHTTVEFIDYNDVNGVKYSEIDLEERKMTEPEMEKKEDIVKGMKKGLSGFKERYGDRAKEVMYATATKQAMKEEYDSEHYKAGHDHASDHAQDSGFKVTARARKKEMLADNPHKKGTPEHSDWHKGANDGHQMALDNM
jgi:hypothetical protein